MKSHNEFLKEVETESHFTNKIKKALSPESKKDSDVKVLEDES